jgi:hypothetical protein
MALLLGSALLRGCISITLHDSEQADFEAVSFEETVRRAMQ